jgi:hypothetical protein
LVSWPTKTIQAQEHGPIWANQLLNPRPCSSPYCTSKIGRKIGRKYRPIYRFEALLPVSKPLGPTTGCLAFPWHGRGRRFDPDQVHQIQLLALTASVLWKRFSRDLLCYQRRKYCLFAFWKRSSFRIWEVAVDQHFSNSIFGIWPEIGRKFFHAVYDGCHGQSFEVSEAGA